jgi:uncharacterized protein (DUF2141 family)
MKRLMMTALLVATGVHAGELKLELHGKGMAGNQIRVAIYSAAKPELFPSDDKFYKGLIGEAAGENLIVTMPDLPPGKYAVAAYVDNNKNGKHDKNFMGVPKEDYGFSNDARGMLGPPDFSAAEFELGEASVSKSINLH